MESNSTYIVTQGEDFGDIISERTFPTMESAKQHVLALIEGGDWEKTEDQEGLLRYHNGFSYVEAYKM